MFLILVTNLKVTLQVLP